MKEEDAMVFKRDSEGTGYGRGDATPYGSVRTLGELLHGALDQRTTADLRRTERYSRPPLASSKQKA